MLPGLLGGTGHLQICGSDVHKGLLNKRYLIYCWLIVTPCELNSSLLA